MWKHRGQERPPFAREPAPGQESVWDYPRPPAIVPDARRVEVFAGDALIARSDRAVRVLETASPPAIYLPPEDVHTDLLEAVDLRTWCEWKGAAAYWTVAADPGEPVAWAYPDPKPDFDAIRDWFSFYPGRVRCVLGGEEVRPQSGPYYGGWVTDEIVGPYKGEPGTGGW